MNTDSDVIYSVHPLVLLNISDHFNRNRLQNSNSNGIVFGALLGTQSGPHFELFTSFEVQVNQQQDQWNLNTDLFVQRLELYKTVFPDYDFLGWYSTSITEPLDRELELHQQFMKYNELPLYGRLDPTLLLHSFNLSKQNNTTDSYPPSECKPDTEQHTHQSTISLSLPFLIYESRMDPHLGSITFTNVPIRIDTIEAERIAVENIAKDTGSNSGSGAPLIAHLTSQRNALEMLHMRIKTLLNYVESVHSGAIRGDPALLRQIASITYQLPSISGKEFAHQFTQDYNDVLLTLYMAVLTKTTYRTNDLVDRHLEAVTSSNANSDRTSSGYPSIGSRRSGRPRGQMNMY